MKNIKMKLKLTILMCMILIVLPIVSADLNTSLPICDMDNDIDISDMPCMEITPALTNWTGDCNVSIVNTNYSTINYTINMTPYIEGKYNFSFDVNYSNNTRTFYTLTLCDNSTTNVIVNFVETANELWYIYLLFFFSFAIIFIIGELKENFIFKYIAGSFLLIIGLYLFVNGIPGQALSFLSSGNSSAWVSWASFILIFLGLAYTLRTVYENVWGGEEEEW